MAKYVMFKKEPQSNSGITNPERQIIDMNTIYKVVSVVGDMVTILNFGEVRKSYLEDVTVLDIDLQRVNNIVIGTLNYMEYDFKNEERVFALPDSCYRERSLVLYKDKIGLVRENKGFSDDIHFNSQQEAQDYVDKFSKIIDEINMNPCKNIR